MDKNYDILDCTKFILSIMIVAIHSSLWPMQLYPWLKLAIPLFFIISSFLLYDRINKAKEDERGKIIKKYVIRQAKLYLFWFIVLLPITIIVRRNWFELGILDGIRNVITNFLFSSTFSASWYITASITAILIITKVTQKIKNNKVLFLIFLATYFICCLVSSYSFLFTDMKILKRIYYIYSSIFTSPIWSFPAALLWMFIGKLFADNKLNIISNCKKKNIVFGLILSAVLLFIEWKLVYNLTARYNNDCYFFLIPMAILIFYLILPIRIHLNNPKILRNISTIIYLLHASLIPIIRAILVRWINPDTEIFNVFVFLINLTICYFGCFVIFKLENKKGFKVLKYSH